MEFVSKYWLTIAVSVYLLAMVLHGHYRGFIRIAVSMFALVASLIVVRIGMPYVTGYLKENTALHSVIQDGMLKAVGFGETDDEEPEEEQGEETKTETIMPSVQRQLIEQLNIPEALKETLIENNNSEVYELLGVKAFTEYIGSYLSNMIIQVIGFLLLFILSYILIRLVVTWLNLFSRLPIIHGVNQILGAILGGLEGLAVLWILGLVVTICSGTDWGAVIIAQINGSAWLTFLYRNNLFQWIIMGILGSMF